MSGLDLSAIRQGLVDTIKAGVTRDVRGYPYPLGNEELPCVVVNTGDDYITYNTTLGQASGGAMCDVNLELILMARCSVSLEDGQRVLDEMLSARASLPNSVIDAIEADRTLGGVVQECKLGAAGRYEGSRPDTEGRPQAVVVTVPVQIWMRRS